MQPNLADAPTGTVAGTVRDPGGHPVPGAFLSLPVNEQIIAHYFADAQGRYSIIVTANQPVGPLCAITGSGGTVVPGGRGCTGEFTVAPGATLVLDIALTPMPATPTPAPQPPGGAPAPAATPSPAPPSPAPSATASSTCHFILGLGALHGLLPSVVGACLDDEAHGANGDALQHTTKGLLVWRKADNWTAFTDGYRTWVNGPKGIQERLNTQRFAWEANPGGLPVIP